MRRLHKLTGIVALSALALSGCVGSDSDSPTTEITIFAAASLQASFDELAEAFNAENPDITVAPIVYDGSSTLVTQLIEGADADVLATAAESNMADAIEGGVASASDIFATNTLVVATPADNPGNVTALEDLANVTTVLCDEEVPCGAAAKTLLERQNVTVTPASLEQNVTAVLTKVAAGEADAGLVYATDVIGEDAVASFVPEGAEDVVNRYAIATLEGASDAGAAFVEFVLSEKGQAILASYGFGAP